MIFSESFLHKIARFLLHLVFLAPLLVFTGGSFIPGFIFPFIVPKILFFRTLIVLLLAIFICLSLQYRKKYQIRLSPIAIAVLAFLFSFLLSTFFGTDWYRSFWDNHERMLGLFTLFHYVLFFFFLRVFITNDKEWRALFRTFLGLGSIVMLIAVWQKIQPDFFLNNDNPRVSATLGNPIYLSGYGLFLFVLGLFLFFREEKIWLKILASVGSLLGFLGILFGGTRGTLLGFLVGVFVVLVSLVVFYKKNPKLGRISLILLGLGVLGLGLLLPFRESTFVKNIPGIGRLADSHFDSNTATTRIMAWEIGFKAWKERPVFGWGPGNYMYAFNKYYNPNFLNFGWGETWFDNAHNVVVNTLATQGILGVISYLSLFGVSFFLLFRSYRKDEVSVSFFVLTTGFLSAHFVHNFFVFENPTSYLYFFFFLAFIDSVLSPAKEKIDVFQVERTRWIVVACVFTIISTGAIFWVTDVNTARANIKTLSLIRNLYGGKWNEGEFKAIEKLHSPHIDDIRGDVARTAIQVTPQYAESKQNQQGVNMLRFLYAELQKNQALHPLDVRVPITKAQVAQYLTTLGFPNLYVEQERILSEALVLSPRRQQLIYMLSATKFALNKPVESLRLLQQAVDDNKKIAENWWRLAYMYDVLGRKQEAIAVIKKAQQEPDLIFHTDNDKAMFAKFLEPAPSGTQPL